MNEIVLNDYYKECSLCPLNCKVDRTNGKVGICGQTDQLKIAWVGLHKGEEPPISGSNGSGTIFFSGCSLQCQHCQNLQISRLKNPLGFPISIDELVFLMLDLQKEGSTNINLVTATHFVPSVIKALEIAKQKGLTIPIVYNSGGFESVETLKLLEPYVDTYLIDLKTLDKRVAKKFCKTEKYIDVVKSALFYLFGKSKAQIIVRHLLFPGEFKATEEALRWFAKHGKKRALLSLMVQFVDPLKQIENDITEDDYDALIDLLVELKIEEGFVQELGDESVWLPDFTKENPFLDDFAKPLDSFNQLRSLQTSHLLK